MRWAVKPAINTVNNASAQRREAAAVIWTWSKAANCGSNFVQFWMQLAPPMTFEQSKKCAP